MTVIEVTTRMTQDGERMWCTCGEFGDIGACEHVFEYIRDRRDAPLPDRAIVPIFRRITLPGLPASEFSVNVVLGAVDARGFSKVFFDARGFSKVFFDEPARIPPIMLASEHEGRYILRDAILRRMHEIDDNTNPECGSALHDSRFVAQDARSRMADKFLRHYRGKCARCERAEKEMIPGAGS